VSFKLTLKERKSPHAMEAHPRYDVMVGDRKVDELYFNMTGYNGTLMNFHGSRVAIGERGISTWRKEARRLNTEAREIMDLNDADPRRIAKAERTLDGDLRKLTFDDGSDICVRDDQYRAGVELFGEDRLSPAYFEPQENRVAIYPHSTIRTGEIWGDPSFSLKIFETDNPDQMAVIIGQAPAITGKVIYGATGHELPENWQSADLAEAIGDDWFKSSDRVAFISRDTMEDIIDKNGRDFIRADMLPGHGFSSEKAQIFSEVISSSSQRPSIVLDEKSITEYGEFLAQERYSTTMSSRNDVDECDAPTV